MRRRHFSFINDDEKVEVKEKKESPNRRERGKEQVLFIVGADKDCTSC
jgi:hypothetical protein